MKQWKPHGWALIVDPHFHQGAMNGHINAGRIDEFRNPLGDVTLDFGGSEVTQVKWTVIDGVSLMDLDARSVSAGDTNGLAPFGPVNASLPFNMGDGLNRSK